MHEDTKLNEASYFLTQMVANEDNPHAFAHNLSRIPVGCPVSHSVRDERGRNQSRRPGLVQQPGGSRQAACRGIP